MSIKRAVRDFFGFSKTEVNGALVLICLIIFLLSTPYLFRQISPSNNLTHYENKRLLDSLISFLDTSSAEEEPKVKVMPVYFDFDPNKASVADFEQMGIPKFLAKRIDNYRSKGGVFRVKSDLKKIYDFPDSLYHQLFEFMALPEVIIDRQPRKVEVNSARTDSPKVTNTELAESKELFKLDINLADTSALQRIKGIGPSYARRIVAYRELLGGYHSVSQLQEVYGMTNVLFDQMEQHIVVSDTVAFQKIAINLATFKELLAHPYIDYEQTKELLNVKSKYGKFKKPQDLYRLQLMDSAAIDLLLPYISF